MIAIQEFLNRLSSAAESIRNAEEKRKALAGFLKNNRDCFAKCHEMMEEKLICGVAPQSLFGKKVLAVDGGVSQHSYHGIELALLRAVAVFFEYPKNSGEKPAVSYYPSASPYPKLFLAYPPQETLDISNERMQEEIGMAISAAKRFSPDILLMDGMIVPHLNDIPKEDSESRERFAQTVNCFKNLYDSSLSILLAGCIEDSRGKKFCEILSRNGIFPAEKTQGLRDVLAMTSDTSLLYYLLDCGERTCAFRFSGEGLINILGEEGKNIYSFYMKTAEFDRPLRVDFYCKNAGNVADTAGQISSLILSSCCHGSYGFPAPLIEADFRAKLPEQDAEKMRDQLLDRVGLSPSLMKLRRELRPL